MDFSNTRVANGEILWNQTQDSDIAMGGDEGHLLLQFLTIGGTRDSFSWAGYR